MGSFSCSRWTGAPGMLALIHHLARQGVNERGRSAEGSLVPQGRPYAMACAPCAHAHTRMQALHKELDTTPHRRTQSHTHTQALHNKRNTTHCDPNLPALCTAAAS